MAKQIAVIWDGEDAIEPYRALAERFVAPLMSANEVKLGEYAYLLTWRDGCLTLFEPGQTAANGLTVDIEHRQGEQRSWPIAKTGALAQALGRKTHTIVDATAGWGQDALAMFRMGFDVTAIERCPLMAELLADGFRRLSQLDWMQRLQLAPPKLLQGDAIQLLRQLSFSPDCIYLDPMFPPKRKKSALAKKSIMLLRDLAGEDSDKAQLFEVAMQQAAKRVVVKSPDYAEPLGGKPNESFEGKLVRYDMYLSG